MSTSDEPSTCDDLRVFTNPGAAAEEPVRMYRACYEKNIFYLQKFSLLMTHDGGFVQ